MYSSSMNEKSVARAGDERLFTGAAKSGRHVPARADWDLELQISTRRRNAKDYLEAYLVAKAVHDEADK